MNAYQRQNSILRPNAPDLLLLGACRETSTIREFTMRNWKRPTVRQVTCGMEINMYFPAEL